MMTIKELRDVLAHVDYYRERLAKAEKEFSSIEGFEDAPWTMAEIDMDFVPTKEEVVWAQEMAMQRGVLALTKSPSTT